MTTTARLIASGTGWAVADVTCTATAADAVLEEEHGNFCVAAVTAGTFRYRTSKGTAMMMPGAILLGNQGGCFECGHEHAHGDRCLAFHFDAEFFEGIVASLPGASRLQFERPNLPPSDRLTPLLARAEAARDRADALELEELSVAIGGEAAAAASGCIPDDANPTSRDQKRMSDAVRWIELNAERPVSLGDLASESATSPFHFLRAFKRLAGMTPYQFLLRTRMHRAAVRLRVEDAPISTIAYDAGFNDLSTFNRRFRDIVGQTPGAFRMRYGHREKADLTPESA